MHIKKLTLILAIFVSLNINCQTQEQEIVIQKQIIALHKDLKKAQDSVGALIKVCDLEIEKASDLIAKEKLNKKLTYLWDIYDMSLREEALKDLDFAKLHPNSLSCLKLLLNKVQTQEGLGLYDKYEEIFHNFSEEVKASEEGKKMTEKLKYFKQSKVGSVAPDFSVIDINGKELSLNDFRGKKYILLDFWASWCAPCIVDQKYLKKIYGRFSQKDFEIISISRDTDKEKWKNTVLKHKTNIWKQVCIESDLNICTNDLPQKKHSVDVNYFVSAIPHYVLIDKAGIIIGKWKNSGEINMKELETKLSDVIGN
ncbi:TlpA family protein disulfide reductase [Flavobacterium sufflavum]|uniref:TlpA family protein disulfide reductase n=1 Tax=Flavobacterium sufflavum TaxID=1921138 RepID=A0A3S2TZD0_9FLAO|nr:TlpA disulfide reductase family protein [Flavobacterium sufflavum]RVT72770.1 TlpA family protein disulfide reductase [Flavobacterium sufflavum]